MLTLYHHPNCGTCKKAIAWLKEQGVAHTRVDLRETSPPDAALRRARSEYPMRGLFNTSGQAYRAGGVKDKLPDWTDDQAIDALRADGMLCKRPIAVEDAGPRITVGFKPDVYAEVWGG